MKAYWVDDGIAVYEADTASRIFANIFLFWKDPDILLVGGLEVSSHSDLQKKGRALTPKTFPVGAGVIENEKIISWESPELKIVTPEKFRQIISEAIGF